MTEKVISYEKRRTNGFVKSNDDIYNPKNLFQDSVPKLPSIEEDLKQQVDNGSLITLKEGRKKSNGDLDENDISLHVSFFVFFSFGLLLAVAYVKEFLKTIFGNTLENTVEKNREDYVPLLSGFETLYFRYVYRPIKDCFENPICSAPGEHVTIMERKSDDDNWNLYLTGKRNRCINIGSYNYLGFAESSGLCRDQARQAIQSLGVGTASTRTEIGHQAIHEELERLTAEFIGTEACISFGMGYATNVLNIPALVGPGCLVLSDASNHASIIVGLRLSGATLKVVRHNNTVDLEKKIRRAIIEGHPRTRRPWKKILIVVEGIYSMEGTICDLKKLIEIKKKYKAYLYVDEAHSIGALGARGGGVADHYGCDPKDIDMLMGTYTKSFAAAGGYICGTKELIDHLRINSDAQRYASSMAPPVCQQIITSINVIMGKDGSNRGLQIRETLQRNVLYFRQRLQQIGILLDGDESSEASPVVPAFTYLPGMTNIVHRELMKRGIATVGVGFPATKISGARIRFCVSASHSKESLDKIIEAMDEIGDFVRCKYGTVSNEPPVEW